MIIVTVELLSAIDGRRQQLAQMHICNDGSGTAGIGNYHCTALRGRSAEQLARGVPQRKGRVEHYRRLDLHVWNLVARALSAMHYNG